MAFSSDALGYVLSYGGTALQVVALLLLVRGPVSRYFPLFLYLITIIAVTVSLGWIYSTTGPGDNLYFRVYWGGEFLTDLLQFSMLISLTLRALEGSPIRPKAIRLLAIVTVVGLIVPFILFEGTYFGRHWNQSTSQLLNFGAAIMNLVLWSALVLGRQRDRQLLTVSAGWGITVTCAALALGIRQFTDRGDSLRDVADVLYRVGQIVGPLIWCKAFWPTRPKMAPSGPLPTVSAS